MMKYTLIIFLFFFQHLCYGQYFKSDTTAYFRDSGGVPNTEQLKYDVKFYNLDLKVEPEEKRISGSSEMTASVLETLDKIILDLDPLLSIDTIWFNGSVLNDLKWAHKDGEIIIHSDHELEKGQIFKVKVFYSGHPLTVENPRKGGFGDGFYFVKTPSGKDWISVVSVMTGADVWFPCKDAPYDEPDSMSIKITTRSDLEVISNGKLMSITSNNDNTRTHHWFVSYPISNYGVTLNIAPFKTLEQQIMSVDGNTYPYKFWVIPESYDEASIYFPEMTKDLLFLESLLGPFPFQEDKCGLVQTYYIGMETQSAIGYGNKFSPHSCGFNITHLHEMAHEWIANMVTVSDWKDMWIHEGIATYIEMLYAEKIGGYKGYLDLVERRRKAVKNEKPIIFNQEHVSIQRAFHMDIYYKGAVMLHTLRYLIGKDAIVKSLRQFLYPNSEILDGRSNTRLTNSEDFIEVVESVSDTELSWFFDAYLYHAGLPNLIVEDSGDQLQLSWETPSDFPFEMPLMIEIEGKINKIKMKNGKGQIATNGADYNIDPENSILKTIYKESKN